MKKVILSVLLLMSGSIARAQWTKTATGLIGSLAQAEGAMTNCAGVAWVGQSSLWSSTDGGVTWVKNSLSPSGSILHIFFLDKNNGLVTTHFGYVYRTTDGGASWSQILSIGSATSACFLDNTSNILVSEFQPGRVHYSRDGGTTWNTVSIDSWVRQIVPKSNGVAYLLSGNWPTAGHLWKTTDYGATWTEAAGHVDADSYSFDLGGCNDSAVVVDNEEYSITADYDGRSELFTSTNDGATWSVTANQPSKYFAGCVTHGLEAFFCQTVSEVNLGLVRSTDDGQTWKNIGGPSCTGDTRLITAFDDNHLIAADVNGNIWVTYNSGGDSIDESKFATISTPEMISVPFPPSLGCPDTAWEPLSVGCQQFQIDSVRIENNTSGDFHLDTSQRFPQIVSYYGSDSVKIIFVPSGHAGNFSAYLHLFGTLLGSGSHYDTTMQISALATSGSPIPLMSSTPFDSVTGCSDTSVWEPISIGCAQFRIDSVRIEGDGSGVFHLDSKQKLPRTIGFYGSDSVHVIFVPLGKAGTFQAFVHVYGTLLGSGTPFDTLLPIQAVSTSTGNPLPSIRYAPFIPVESCADGDAYAFLKLGCAQFRIDSVKIQQDTAAAFALDPTQKYPFTLLANKSDSIHVLFDPNNRLGSYGAVLHVYGTDLGSGTSFDTILLLTATSILPSPVFYTYPSQIDWTSVVECSSGGDTTVTFQNQGCDTVSVDSLHIVSGLTLSSTGLALPVRVPPKGYIKLTVHFAPNGLNPDSLSARLFYSAPGFLDSIPISISAKAALAAPVLTALTPKVSFGNVSSCDTVDTTVWLTNTGCDSLTITSLSQLGGSFANDPPISLPITIAKGDSVELHFTYHPHSAQDTQTVFVGTHNGKQTSTVKINLSGVASTGTLSASATVLSLQTTAICGEADSMIIISNTSCDTMVITSAYLYPDGIVELIDTMLPIILPPNSDTMVHVRFASNKAVHDSTTLTLLYTSHGIIEPEIQVGIASTATSSVETLALSATALSVASLPICQTDSLFAWLYNPGCDTLLISASGVTGDPDFVLLAPQATAKILPQDSIRVRVALIPQAKGTRNGVFHFRYTNTLGTLGPNDSTIDLSALITGGRSALAASLASAELGTVSECASSDTTITLFNGGCDTIEIDSAVLANSYFTITPGIPPTVYLAPDSSVALRIGTNLDTAGHPANLASALTFRSPDTALAPIPLSYNIRYAVPSSLELIPMAASARADSLVYYDIRDADTLANFGVTDVHFALHTSDLDVLGYDTATSLNTIAEDSSSANGIANYDFDITGTPIQQLADGTLARIWFRAYVAKQTETSLWIDSTHFDSVDTNFERCTAYLLPPKDTTFSLLEGCGDSTMRAVMNGEQITLRIENDGGRTLVAIHSPVATTVRLRVFNLLGAAVAEEPLALRVGETEYALPQSLPSGAFFLLLSDANGPAARAAGINLRP